MELSWCELCLCTFALMFESRELLNRYITETTQGTETNTRLLQMCEMKNESTRHHCLSQRISFLRCLDPQPTFSRLVSSCGSHPPTPSPRNRSWSEICVSVFECLPFPLAWPPSAAMNRFQVILLATLAASASGCFEIPGVSTTSGSSRFSVRPLLTF